MTRQPYIKSTVRPLENITTDEVIKTSTGRLRFFDSVELFKKSKLIYAFIIGYTGFLVYNGFWKRNFTQDKIAFFKHCSTLNCALGAFIIGMYSGYYDKNLPKPKLTFFNTPSITIAATCLSSIFLAQRLDDGNVFEIAPLLLANFGYLNY
jgi:hypothetical protein